VRVTSVAGLDAVEPEWGALADRLGAPPSLHPGYARAWARAYADPADVLVGTVREDGALVAAAAAVRRGAGRLAAMSEAEEWGVVAPDAELAAEAVGALLHEGGGVSARLRPVPVGGMAARALRAAAAGRPLMARVVDTQPLVEIGGDWDAYWAGIPQKRNLKRVRRRLEELGEVRMVTVRDPADVAGALREALRIEASGWKGRSGTALAQSEAGRRFYDELAHWAAARGWLRLELLMAGDAAVAFAFDLAAHGVRYSLKIGYDEAHAKASPGRILLAEQVRAAFGEGLRRFDFAGSAQEFKMVWATDTRDYAEILVFGRGPAGRAAHAAEVARWTARPAAKRLRDEWRRRRGGDR
jgi:CelD/BcsL family acetyltransferase involved in cellulose biosynthesis